MADEAAAALGVPPEAAAPAPVALTAAGVEAPGVTAAPGVANSAGAAASPAVPAAVAAAGWPAAAANLW